MINRSLKGVAIGTLMCVGAVAAQAADLPTKKEAPAPVFVPPPFTWTGFYVGLNAGGIFGTNGNASSTVYANGFPFLYTTWPNGSNGSNSGFIGGGQAGYNWQSGAFVFGVETDFDGSSLSRSKTLVGPNFGVNPFGLPATDYLTANGKISLDWLGSTRGRIGFVATPDNRLMIYGTGGVAYGGFSGHLNVYDATDGFYWSSNNSSNTRVGWVAGAGVEYAFTNNWIIGAEYLYFDLGTRYLTTVPNLAASNFFGASVYSQSKINLDASVVRARISYKF